MTVRVVPLEPALEEAYERVVLSAPHSFIYASLAYRDFLRRLVPAARARYLVALRGGRAVGVLPAFLLRDAEGRGVLNSLPFYGSNGGVLVDPGAPDPEPVWRALLGAFEEIAEGERVAASTLVSHPLDESAAVYAAHARHDLVDERIGQLSPLPAGCADAAERAARLMEAFHQKTRNAVRKAEKSGVQVSAPDDPELLRTLAGLHRENMEAIGGAYKEWPVFQALAGALRHGRDYRVYAARVDGETVAALMVLFHNGTAEYFVPATRAEFRALQPMSLLVYHAMQEAAARGCRWWNWGGTWTTQAGVYQFKSRWGTVDRPYRYFTRVLDPAVLGRTPAELLAAFRYFYVVPFSALEARA